MTDARLQSTKPIDDEVPFAESDGDRDTAARPGDALVKPATAERERMMTAIDPDIDPSERPGDDADLTGAEDRVP